MESQCETFSIKLGRVRCPDYAECHTLGYCLCEAEPQEDGSQPAPRRQRKEHPPHIRWAERRKQLLDLAREKETFTTKAFRDFAGVHNSTASHWIKRLVEGGALVIVRPAIKKGADHRSAIYAIAHKED